MPTKRDLRAGGWNAAPPVVYDIESQRKYANSEILALGLWSVQTKVHVETVSPLAQFMLQNVR